jgi:CheY-like chemotaxis protein
MPATRHILLVEADPVSRAHLAKLLAADGDVVATAANANEALAHLRTNSPPSLVVLDSGLTCCNSHDLRNLQRADARLARVPLLVLGDRRDERERAGDFNCLNRPVDPNALRAAVKRLARPRQPQILVVDDEPALLLMLERALRYYGFFPRVVRCGDAAIGVYEQHADEIDVVLLDVEMTPVDGPQALVALRTINPHVQAVFMSGGMGKYSAEELLARGAEYVFAKPLEIAELIRRLWDLVGEAETHW